MSAFEFSKKLDFSKHLTLPQLTLPMPKLGLAAWRGRMIFRGVFLLLMLATVVLAYTLLQEEKARSHVHYAQNLRKTLAETTALLRHPAGQLALLNPSVMQAPLTPLRPLLLPYAAIDFDDQNKAHQAVELAGCSLHYAQGEVCVGIGNNPYAGGFIYVVGQVQTTDLVGRELGIVDIAGVHRLRISLTHSGQTTHWLAPFEAIVDAASSTKRGKLAGFLVNNDLNNSLDSQAKPARDFRGWLWQPTQCLASENCTHTTYYSVRLPVAEFSQALFKGSKPVWPPADLAGYQVQVQVFAPLTNQAIFDSNTTQPSLPFALDGLNNSLQAGEILTVQRALNQPPLLIIKGTNSGRQPMSALQTWSNLFVTWLPVTVNESASKQPVQLNLHSTMGELLVNLQGNTQVVDAELGRVTARMVWVILAMLAAIALAWLLVELSFLRRIALLTKRAATVSYHIQDRPNNAQLDLTQRIQAMRFDELTGQDEVGILANSLRDLLQKVQDDVKREQIRAEQDRDMWHAVGHEIMSPLQSLMVLHPKETDASYRYVKRMQQAVKVLYGHASPSEAIQAANLDVQLLDLNAFLSQVANNAHFAGLAQVEYQTLAQSVMVHADAFSLEDVLTHILNNANRHRTPNTAIQLQLIMQNQQAVIGISNVGEPIPVDLLSQLFEYGVSQPLARGSENSTNTERRGQGLFVVKSYMAKMGGSVRVANLPKGVAFYLTLTMAAY